MKKIINARGYSSYFKKCKKESPNFVQNYKEVIRLFLIDPEFVNDHALAKKNLSGKRAFSVTEDIRVVYIETNNSYILLRVGSHNEVYG